MAKYRTFTKEDWWAWGGAESFSSSKEPFIYECNLNDGQVEVTVIADKNGLDIHFFAEDGDDENIGYYKEMNLSSIQAEGELSHLIDYIEQYTYAPDLTYELDHPSSDIVQGFTSYN